MGSGPLKTRYLGTAWKTVIWTLRNRVFRENRFRVNSGIQEPLFRGEKALFAILIGAVFWHYLESRNTMFRLGPLSCLKRVSIWDGSK